MKDLLLSRYPADTQLELRAPLAAESFMDVAVWLGAEFLSSGGSVTRLEAQLCAAGEKAGLETIVHATPSSITVFCHLRNEQKSFSRGARMQQFGVDLRRLIAVDGILRKFAQGNLNHLQIVQRMAEMKRVPQSPHMARAKD